MRIALIVSAAIALTLAGFVVTRHQIAAAQAERKAVEIAGEAAGSEARPAEAAPAAADPNQSLPAPQRSAARTPAARPVETTPPRLGTVDENQPQPRYPADPFSGPGGQLPTGPNGFVPTLQGGWQRDFAFPVASAADPETHALTAQDQQLEAEVQSLARQLTDDDNDQQRTELKQKLSAALEKQFDAQQKLRELEISRIEARVQKLRDLVRKRTDARRKIIDNRYEQLLNDAEGLGWNSTASGAVQFGRPNPAGFPARLPGQPSAGPLALPRRQ
ncbi:MAG: hypothetical protein ACREHD_03925 [Pirellulales bacterium]